jgi:alpha-glucosidase
VPNHTSGQHPWFQESRSSRLNRKRHWYVWRDAKPDGSSPNNWESEFGGPAWTFDEAAGQYYYHAYLKEQPDLNWRNPEVEQAMCEVLRFWFNRGVDGFRVDAIHHLHEDEEYRDNPPNPIGEQEWRGTRAGCKSERSINRACTPRSRRCDGLLTPILIES